MNVCQLKAFWYSAGILLKWSNTIRILSVQLVVISYISDYSIGYVTVQLVVYTCGAIVRMIDFLKSTISTSYY
jgi:hypothetical protein